MVPYCMYIIHFVYLAQIIDILNFPFTIQYPSISSSIYSTNKSYKKSARWKVQNILCNLYVKWKLLINLLALNAHFCNSPMSMNRKYADKLLVEKSDLRRRAVMQLYCHHYSKYENNSGQFQILIAMKLKRWLNLYVLHDPTLVWCIPLNKWVDFFSLFLVSIFMCVLFCMGPMCSNKLLNWIESRNEIPGTHIL